MWVIFFRPLVMDLAGVAAEGQDKPDVRLIVHLGLRLPVTLNYRQDGAINNIFFGRPSFDVPMFGNDDDDDDEDDEASSDDNDDFDVDQSSDSDDDSDSEMDTDEASYFDDDNNDDHANATEDEIDNNNDRGYDSDDSVKFLFEVINLD